MLLEVLRRSAHDWVLYRSSSRLLQRQIAEEAYHWIFTELPGTSAWVERALNKKEITSFISICEILSLDPEVVRTYIKGLTVKEILSTGRPPTYRRQKERKKKVLALPAPVLQLPAVVVVVRPRVVQQISMSLSAMFEKAANTLASVLLQLQTQG